MSKRPLFLAFLFLVITSFLVYGAEKRTYRMTNFKYQNSNGYNTAVGDTVIGTGADSIYVGLLSQRNSLVPEQVFLVVNTTEINNQDTIAVHLHKGFGNVFETTASQIDTLVGTGNEDFFIEYNFAAGNDAATGYLLRVVGMGDATDTTAYSIDLIGVYSEGR